MEAELQAGRKGDDSGKTFAKDSSGKISINGYESGDVHLNGDGDFLNANESTPVSDQYHYFI